MKKAVAETSLSTYLECPYCDQCVDFEPCEYDLNEEQFGAENINLELECDECGKHFILDKIEC